MLNNDILKKNPVYSAIEYTMRQYQLSYLGGMSFKMDVRKKRPSEDGKLHQDVIENTSVMPVAKYIVDTVNNTVFSQPITRDLEFAYPNGMEIEDENLTEWTELVCYDADLNNRSLDQVMEEVGELTSIFGHCWVFVDMPNVQQGISSRPYVTSVSPLKVHDWKFSYINGRPTLSYVKVLEHESTDCFYYKCYYLGTKTDPSYWRSYEADKIGNLNQNARLLDEGQFPPGMSIPGFIVYTRRDPRLLDIGVSDIDSASDVQREIYKLECEAYQSIQFARTLIRADNGIKVPAGAGGIIRGTQGQVETLSVDTQDVSTIISKQQDLLTSLENLSGLSGLRQNRATPQSGVSIIEERRSLHKVASAKAREMEICEEKIWTYMARFMNMRWAGNIVYGIDYEESDVKMKIAKLEIAKNLSGQNPVINGIINRNVLKMLVDDEEFDFYLEKMTQVDQYSVKYEEQEEQHIETSDIGDQVPDTLPEDAHNDKDGIVGNPGIQYVGETPYNPVAQQLLADAGGR